MRMDHSFRTSANVLSTYHTHNPSNIYTHVHTHTNVNTPVHTDQLVMTISTPCYQNNGDSIPPTLVGVAAVDLTVADLFAGVEYFKEGGLSYSFVIDENSEIAWKLLCILTMNANSLQSHNPFITFLSSFCSTVGWNGI